ncbi:hypothetical protein RF11_03751 [Thelohanellus kitauei]|uniref:Uncharacterized protein n=1 Tax=Thelohanellus kitauei TaxID=669202 RepID=A0A0C2N7B7_THEKT|nr:hypothetical protein RF11_03751 [Thelohanellus kitauei]
MENLPPATSPQAHMENEYLPESCILSQTKLPKAVASDRRQALRLNDRPGNEDSQAETAQTSPSSRLSPEYLYSGPCGGRDPSGNVQKTEGRGYQGGRLVEKFQLENISLECTRVEP